MVCPTSAPHIVFQAYGRAVTEHIECLQRLEQERHDQVKAGRLHPGVAALQALRGVQFTVAVTTLAALGDLTRFDNPQQLMTCLGLIPADYARRERSRQGIGMKLSIDSLCKCDSFNLFLQAFSKFLRRGASFSRRFDSQAFCGGTGTLQKAAQLERRLKDGLHPPPG